MPGVTPGQFYDLGNLMLAFVMLVGLSLIFAVFDYLGRET